MSKEIFALTGFIFNNLNPTEQVIEESVKALKEQYIEKTGDKECKHILKIKLSHVNEKMEKSMIEEDLKHTFIVLIYEQ